MHGQQNIKKSPNEMPQNIRQYAVCFYRHNHICRQKYIESFVLTSHFHFVSLGTKCKRCLSRCNSVTSIYRVIRKSLRDFRPLQDSSRNGHAEGKHVNRGRDTRSFCPTLQVLDMSNLGDAADVNPANSKTQNAFLLPVHAMFRHDYPIAAKTCKYATTPGTQKNLERFSTY